jgi:hypothetical protein
MLPSVDCITTTSVSEFSVYTGGCDAGLPQLIFMGIAPKKVALADINAAMAQDRVGGCDVEIEVRQHEMV